MKKIDKILLLPVMCHIALFMAMIILEVMKNSMVGIIGMAELCGVIVTPMFYAVMSIANAIVYDKRVSENFVKCVLYVAGIGLLRVIIYLILAPSTIKLPLGALVVSVAVFCLWESLFALTDKMMRKKRTGNRKK